MDEGLWSMVSAAGGMEKAILVVLAVCSIILWSIVFLKIPEFRAAKRNSALFMTKFLEAENFNGLSEMQAPASECVQFHIFKAALRALGSRRDESSSNRTGNPGDFKVHPGKSTEEIVLLSMQHTSTEYFGRMQRGLSFMATIGSTTPFIGLFGTVVGIMTTFQDLGTTKTPSMQVVAPGISGALVATAAGLAVAIPAVIWCNWFLAELDEIREGANLFIEKAMAVIRANQAAEQKSGPVDSAKHEASAKPAAAPRATVKPAPKAASKPDDEDDEEEDDEDDVPATAVKLTGKRGATS